MLNSFKTLTLVFITTLSTAALAGEKTWNSIYTDSDVDCVNVSLANGKAEIDFMKLECKAFGGYRLYIIGADLRYSASLDFNGKPAFDLSEARFHEMGSTKLEWIYLRDGKENGDGKIEWKGFIFRLKVAVDHGSKNDEEILYAVRLNGTKSCLLGKVNSNEAARALIYDQRAACLK